MGHFISNRKGPFAQTAPSKGGFHENNDTVEILKERLGDAGCCVTFDKPLVSYAEVKEAIMQKQLKVAQQRKIIVPKTMLIHAGGNYVLYTSMKEEEYSSKIICQSLGLDNVDATHKGIDTQERIGRQIGSCSIVLSTQILSSLSHVIISERLAKAANTHSLLVYPAGNFSFFCGVGQQFLEKIGTLITVKMETEIKGNL